jgi:hypothetical protein
VGGVGDSYDNALAETAGKAGRFTESFNAKRRSTVRAS